MTLITLLSYPDKCDPVKCTLCNRMFTDYVEHVFTRCENLNTQRNELHVHVWDYILNELGVEAEVDLFRRTDEQCTRIMLGKKWPLLENEQYEVSYVLLQKSFAICMTKQVYIRFSMVPCVCKDVFT